MIKVVLAGNYPANTFEKVRVLLPEDKFELRAVESMDEYNSMSDAEIMILRIFKASREVIERNRNLKMILRWGTGFDSVDIRAAGERGVIVTNTPGVNAGAVSELAVMLMIAVGRKLLCHTESIRQGKWSRNEYLNSSVCLKNKVVGIIGAGNIGRQVATKVQAFGARVQYFDPIRLSRQQEIEQGMQFVPLDALFRTSDIVSLHIPLNDSTYHIIGEKEIERMKKGAIIINTARGGLIDEHALIDAIKSKRLAGAGIDGVENEPLEQDDALFSDSNIIVTPHIGGGTGDLGDEIIPILAEDIINFFERREIPHVVNKEFLETD